MGVRVNAAVYPYLWSSIWGTLSGVTKLPVFRDTTDVKGRDRRHFVTLIEIHIHRGYYMAAWGYEFYLLVLKVSLTRSRTVYYIDIDEMSRFYSFSK